jgi:hypothetical protein
MNKIYKIGKNKNITYNFISQRLTPSDSCFVYITLSIILIPTFLCVTVAIWMADVFSIWIKVLFVSLDITTLYYCLFFLHKTGSTDPGIIPSLNDSNLLDSASQKPNEDNDYYIEYKNKKEIE